MGYSDQLLIIKNSVKSKVKVKSFWKIVGLINASYVAWIKAKSSKCWKMVTCRMILRRARGCGLKRSFKQIRITGELLQGFLKFNPSADNIIECNFSSISATRLGRRHEYRLLLALVQSLTAPLPASLLPLVSRARKDLWITSKIVLDQGYDT